jgi:hypothetical protein
VAGAPAGIARPEILVAALIEAGELGQGITDALSWAARRDARSTADDAAMALLARIAAAVQLSWDSGFAHGSPVPEAELRACVATPLPAEISAKRAEGSPSSMFFSAMARSSRARERDHFEA